MARPIKPSPAEVVASLEARLSAARDMLETSKMHQRRALIGIEKRVPGSEEEAATLAQGIALRRTEIEGLDDALADARLTVAEQNSEATARAEAKERTASQARARYMLDKAAVLDQRLRAAGEAWRDFEGAHVDFWNGTSIADRQTDLVNYMQGHSEVKPSIRLRLAFETMLDGEMVWDKSEAPRTIEDRMRGALGDHLPALGRPPKVKDDKEGE